MKYITRPAPPPPNPNGVSQQQFSNKFQPVINSNKPKPPRPPPPRVNDTNNKPPVKEQSMKLFSNLFGASKTKSNKSNEKLSASQMEVNLPPPRLPLPPASNHRHHSTTPVTQLTTDLQLINFDESPPASPVGFIKKSNTGGSDSVSMDSFCSTNSSPNNLGFNSGTTSQAESGFEDDFSVSDFKVSSRATSRSTTFSNDPFDCLDEFSSSASTPSTGSGGLPVRNANVHANIRNIKPTIRPKPVSIGNTNFYAPTSTQTFDDSLSSAGKSTVKSTVLSMPTIIKPASLATNTARKPSPTHVPSSQNKKPLAPLQPAYQDLESTSDESYEEPPSPPMPTIPAPILVLDESNMADNDDGENNESYGIALYDFESDVTEDLNFRANEKIYLMQQMNDEWMYGRNKRGCEGIFPISYIDIKVPLKNSQSDSGTASRSESVSPASTSHRVRIIYTFNAETEEDLTIMENDFVNVLYEINSEWLYGSNSSGEYGQFPSNFIEFVPQNLPLMPK